MNEQMNFNFMDAAPGYTGGGISGTNTTTTTIPHDFINGYSINYPQYLDSEKEQLKLQVYNLQKCVDSLLEVIKLLAK